MYNTFRDFPQNLFPTALVADSAIPYDAFLNIQTESNATVGGNLLGQGMVYYRDTGLYGAGPRQENPLTAKWIQFDPSGFSAGDDDLTRFVGNNATNVTDPSGLEWWEYVRALDYVLGDVRTGGFAQTSNFSAGAADTISGGATAWVRTGLGYNDVVDTESSAYRYGGYAGQAVNIGLMCANPLALSSGYSLR